MKSVSAIILAAGKGTRLNCRQKNKVSLSLGGQPMICYTLKTLKKLKLKKIYIVVGFQKQSVIKALGPAYSYIEQPKRLGTGHAVLTAFKKIKKPTKYFLILNGDDSAFYQPSDLKALISKHLKTQADMTLITLFPQYPNHLGRIIRDQKGKIKAIVEYKNATIKQRKIKEINSATYCFKHSFLKKFLPKITKNPVTGEYYLTDLLALAVDHGQKVRSVTLKDPANFCGVNTQKDLLTAQKRIKKL